MYAPKPGFCAWYVLGKVAVPTIGADPERYAPYPLRARLPPVPNTVGIEVCNTLLSMSCAATVTPPTARSRARPFRILPPTMPTPMAARHLTANCRYGDEAMVAGSLGLMYPQA